MHLFCSERNCCLNWSSLKRRLQTLLDTLSKVSSAGASSLNVQCTLSTCIGPSGVLLEEAKVRSSHHKVSNWDRNIDLSTNLHCPGNQFS